MRYVPFWKSRWLRRVTRRGGPPRRESEMRLVLKAEFSSQVLEPFELLVATITCTRSDQTAKPKTRRM